MIRLQSALLANAAQLEPSGLVSLLGGWIDSVAGPEMPVRQQLWVVARLTLEPDDVKVAHTFRLVIEHSDATERVATFDTSIPPNAGPVDQIDPDLPLAIPLVLPMAAEFRRPGLYYVRLIVDGDELWSNTLKVRTVLPQV